MTYYERFHPDKMLSEGGGDGPHVRSTRVANDGRLTDLRQNNQDQGYGRGATNARGDLSKRHELHSISCRENSNVACATLPAVAGSDDGGVDRIHPQPTSNNKSCRYDGDNGRDDGD
jgi:hypothetical protein